MTVSNLQGPDPWVKEAFHGGTPNCFYCGEFTGPVVVVWAGHPHSDAGDGLIVLHVGCVPKFCSNLIVDAAHAKSLLYRKDPLAGIDHSLLSRGTA